VGSAYKNCDQWKRGNIYIYLLTAVNVKDLWEGTFKKGREGWPVSRKGQQNVNLEWQTTLKESSSASHGTTAPSGPEPPHYRGFTITHFLDTPHSVGLLWTSDKPDAETSTWQHTTLTRDSHALGEIRTHNPSKRAATDLRLRPRDHWDRHFEGILCRKAAFKEVPALEKYNFQSRHLRMPVLL
jgi:hypothetical protein